MRKQPSGRGRVAESHRIARTAFTSALVFAVIAAAWSLFILALGGSWWGPLHAFLAGTILLAISGASQMFTITWSATIPPSRIQVATQRWLLIAGASAALVGVTFDIPLLALIGGVAAVAGLVLLGWIVWASVRRSLLRRFDLSARFYLAAFAAGIVGITLGAMMGAEMAGGEVATIRLVHAHLNVVGLVGLTIIGTIPTLLPTTAHSRAVSGREAVVGWWAALVGTAAIAGGLWVPELVGVGAILVAAAGALILGGILGRLWDRGRRKLPFLQISIGTIWLIGWAFIDGIRVSIGGTFAHFSGWTAAVVIAGVGQVLAGSLAYLIPVLVGSPFAANRDIMEERPWLPLMAVNAAGFSLGAGLSLAPVLLSLAWMVDFGIRIVRLRRARSDGDAGGAGAD